MDFDKLDVNAAASKGAEVRLKHPVTNLPIDVWVTVIGQDSDEWLAMADESARKALEAPSDTPIQERLEQTRKDNIERLAKATKGWRGVDLGGKPVPFSVNAARDMYTRFTWMRDQVDQAIANRGNFLKP